jgi:hypothetical protein
MYAVGLHWGSVFRVLMWQIREQECAHDVMCKVTESQREFKIIRTEALVRQIPHQGAGRKQLARSWSIQA